MSAKPMQATAHEHEPTHRPPLLIPARLTALPEPARSGLHRWYKAQPRHDSSICSSRTARALFSCLRL